MAVVLVVDPNADRRATLAKSVRRAGYRAVVASDFDGGVTFVRAWPVYIVATPIVHVWSHVADAPMAIVVCGADEPTDSVLFRVLDQAHRHAE